MLPCSTAKLSPPYAAKVPSNTPAFLIKPYLQWVAPSLTITEDQFSVESRAGNKVPFHLEQAGDAIAIVLDATLSEGQWYYIRYPEYCPIGMMIDEPLELVRPFQTDVPFAQPIGASEVMTLSHRLEVIKVWADSSCTKEIEADVLRVDLARTVPLLVWGPLIRVETVVDGERWAISAPGEPDLSGFSESYFHPSPLTGTRRPTVLFSKCGAPDPGLDNGLSPGKHAVQFHFHVYGLSQPLPSAQIEIEMECPALTESLPDAPSQTGNCAAGLSSRGSPFPIISLLLVAALFIAVRRPSNPRMKRTSGLERQPRGPLAAGGPAPSDHGHGPGAIWPSE